MAAKKKNWTKNDYALEAKEWVACYGVGYCWEEFAYEYTSTWDDPKLSAPDYDAMLAAIYAAGG